MRSCRRSAPVSSGSSLRRSQASATSGIASAPLYSCWTLQQAWLSPTMTVSSSLALEIAGPRDLVGEVDRPLAERDERHVGVRRHGLREHVDRIRVVEDPRVRADVLDVGEDALHRVDRAQRHEEAARPLRLLADDAVLERDPLVEHARREAARPIAREDRVAVGEARAAIGRRLDREVEPARLGHALGEPADQVEPLGIEVDRARPRSRRSSRPGG